MTAETDPVGDDYLSHPLGSEGRNLEESTPLTWLLSSTLENPAQKLPHEFLGPMSLGPVDPFTAAPVAPSQGAGNQVLPPRARHQSAPVLRGKHKPQAQTKEKERNRGRAGRSGPTWTPESKAVPQRLTVPCMGVEAPTY